MPKPVVRRLDRPIMVRTVELAELLTIQGSRLTQLTTDGTIKRKAKGLYDLREAVQDYIRYLREQQKRQQVSTADNRIRDARAKDIEARTAERLGRLVPLSVYDEMIDGFAGIVRSELAGMPAACTRDLTMRRIIERELNARLHRMAEFAKSESIRVGTMGRVDDSERADGARRLGRSKSDLSSNGSDSGAA